MAVTAGGDQYKDSQGKKALKTFGEGSIVSKFDLDLENLYYNYLLNVIRMLLMVRNIKGFIILFDRKIMSFCWVSKTHLPKSSGDIT